MYLKRSPGWEGRCNGLIVELEGLPFKWGQTDCVMVGLRFVDALCGTDFFGTYKDCYSGKVSALRYYRNTDTLHDFLLGHQGVCLIDEEEPRPSDLYFTNSDAMDHCFVCLNNDISLSSSNELGRVYSALTSMILAVKTVKRIIRID